ncbi:hypothetical protein IMSAG025_01704 [Muribaculaceae bacterium]|nr:hypothetical protein IMSAG025_01704 [Muribaculaceae bacterium]
MQVGNEVTAVIIVLHADEFGQGSVVISEVKIACSADSAQNNFFIIIHYHCFLIDIV